MRLPPSYIRSSSTSPRRRVALGVIALTAAVTLFVTACGDDLKFPGQLADTPTPGPASSGAGTPTRTPTNL